MACKPIDVLPTAITLQSASASKILRVPCSICATVACLSYIVSFPLRSDTNTLAHAARNRSADAWPLGRVSRLRPLRSEFSQLARLH
eukprot:5186932-Pleurochrysis_carterae.AAC.3